jgi:hypothetical protein
MPAQFKKASASKTSKLGRVLGMPTAYFSSWICTPALNMPVFTIQVGWKERFTRQMGNLNGTTPMTVRLSEQREPTGSNHNSMPARCPRRCSLCCKVHCTVYSDRQFGPT